MGSNNSIPSTSSSTKTSMVEGMAVVPVPVDVGGAATEAMDMDTPMGTMDAEADTGDTTTYPCHTWAEPRWSNTLRGVFKAYRTQ